MARNRVSASTAIFALAGLIAICASISWALMQFFLYNPMEFTSKVLLFGMVLFFVGMISYWIDN